MAGLCAPLSTLRQHPRGYRRMTRGQCGSLDLHCERLALSTPCRSSRRTKILDLSILDLRLSYQYLFHCYSIVERDRGTPRGATHPTPPGVRVTYHGGSTGLSLDRDIETGGDRVSRNSGCAGLVGPPGVRTCARTPSANQRQPLH